MKKGSIIWGAILILVGLLILLRSFNVIFFSWWHFWRLWPIALIIIGVSVIPMKDWLKIVLTILVVALGIGLIVRPNDGQHESCCSHYFNNWSFDDEDWDDFKNELKDELQKINESNYVTLFDDSVTNVNLKLELTDCDAFSVKQHQKRGLSFQTTGIASYNLTTNTIGSVASCTLEPVELDKGITKADLKLSTRYTYNLDITSKSEYNNLDFSEISISDLNMTAVDDNNLWKMKFGNQISSVNVNLTTNDELDRMIISLPKSAGVSVSATDISDLMTWNGLKKSGEKYVSDNFETSSTQIIISADKLKDLNFSIERY